MGVLTGGLALAAGAAKCVDFIESGSVAVKRRCGRLERKYWDYFYEHGPGERYGMKEQGRVFSLPFFERVIHISTMKNPDNELPAQHVQSAEKYQVTIPASIVWHIMHDEDAVYRALYSVNLNRNTDVIGSLRPLVIDKAARQLFRVMVKKPFDEMLDVDARENDMFSACAEPLSEMGVALDEVIIKSPSFTDAEREGQAKVAAARILAESNLLAAQEIGSAIRDSAQGHHLASVALADILNRTSNQPEQVMYGPIHPDPPLHVLPGGQ